MAILGRDEILGADDLPVEEVEVPEWGGSVLVRGLTGGQRDAFEMMVLNWRDKDRSIENLRATLAAWCIVDADGKRLFNDSSDVRRLAQKSARALERVFDAARRASGLTEADVEELAKNSGGAQSAKCGTD